MIGYIYLVIGYYSTVGKVGYCVDAKSLRWRYSVAYGEFDTYLYPVTEKDVRTNLQEVEATFHTELFKRGFH